MATKTKHPKMDPKLIAANQPHEVRTVRVIFYKMQGEKIVHPTSADVKAAIKASNNSRLKVYKLLKAVGFTLLRVRKN